MHIRQDGTPIRAHIDADSEVHALEILYAQGLTAYDLNPAVSSDQASVKWWQREIVLFGEGTPRRELAEFLNALHVLLKARISLIPALEIAADDIADARLKRAVLRALERVRRGNGLAAAFEDAGPVMPERVRSLFEIGEEANALIQSSLHAATMIQREDQVSSQIRAALTYPLILLSASVFVIVGLIFFLAPAIEPIFLSVDADPPVMIAIMLFIRDGAVNVGVVFLAVLLGLIFSFAYFFRRWGNHILRKMPLIGSLMQDADAFRLASTISLMLSSGATLMEALRMGRSSVRSLALSRDIVAARAALEDGESLTSALGSSSNLPKLVKRAISLGESSNRLSELLANAAHVLDARIQARLGRLTALATPVLTILIGALVGGIVLSTLTAILDVNDLATAP